MPHSNGARLSRLLIDQGTVTMRNYFDFICPPGTLTDVLFQNYETLSELYRRRTIKREQMEKLFPPSGTLPATPSIPSIEYDITLLFILLRNICGLLPPATSWDQLPRLADKSPEADLARIKYYRNKIYGHIISTDVSDDDFADYWSVLSGALKRLSTAVGEEGIDDSILNLRVCSLDNDTDWTRLVLDWFENDTRMEKFVDEVRKKTESNEMYLNIITYLVIICVFLLVVIIIQLSYFRGDFLLQSSKLYQILVLLKPTMH